MALYGRVPPIWDPGIPIELRLSWIVSLFARYSCQGLSLHIFCFLICHSVWIQRRRAPGRLQTKKTGLSPAKSRGFPRSCQTPPQKLQYLVGGLEHFFMFPYIGNNHPNWLIFFRRVETTNQIWLSGGRNHISIYIYNIYIGIFKLWGYVFFEGIAHSHHLNRFDLDPPHESLFLSGHCDICCASLVFFG